MKKSLLAAAVLLISAVSFTLSAQSTFNKNGIYFNYPSGATVEEQMDDGWYTVACQFGTTKGNGVLITCGSDDELAVLNDEVKNAINLQLMDEFKTSMSEENSNVLFTSIQSGSLAGFKGIYCDVSGVSKSTGAHITGRLFSSLQGTKILIVLIAGTSQEIYNKSMAIAKSLRLK